MWNEPHKIQDSMAKHHDSINSITKLTSISCKVTEKKACSQKIMVWIEKKIQRKTI